MINAMMYKVPREHRGRSLNSGDRKEGGISFGKERLSRTEA